MKKYFVIGIVCVLVVGGLVGLAYKQQLDRLAYGLTLFSGAEQYENFNRLAEIFPTTMMTAAGSPFDFDDGEPISLPATFAYKGGEVNVETFLSETDSSALLVIHKGKVRFERYMLTGGRGVKWLSMSVSKSFIATGIGIAVDEGLIDILKPITDYVPSLIGSAYDQVRIKDVLQMSSGAAWNEDYSDVESDIMRLGRIMSVGGSLDEFVGTLTREREPGAYNHYNSADTQALAMLLSRATGMSITDYITDKLWHPLGMESDAYWLVDDENVEMAFGGLNATARDYAKLGELHRLNGAWQGKQIVSASWVAAATTPDAPHLLPGVNKDFPLGYGYQWWVPETSEGEYSAIGVYNQFIYVNPTRDLVIVKLSAFSDYALSLDESSYRELETIAFFRAIGRQLSINLR
ncbi:MAG: CubicO group peptidase (beta-lactamase class C family) [Candidatus Azotimanducaceae bacterium]|jgi:CubicO group peptidase (beta-lactamase class C family)